MIIFMLCYLIWSEVSVIDEYDDDDDDDDDDVGTIHTISNPITNIFIPIFHPSLIVYLYTLRW
jgi:hypothetical protein